MYSVSGTDYRAIIKWGGGRGDVVHHHLIHDYKTK